MFNKSPIKYNLINNTSGEEVKQYYEDIINSKPIISTVLRSGQNKSSSTGTNVSPSTCINKNNKLIKFDKNTLFKAAVVNNIKIFNEMQCSNQNVNEIDQFGWSSIMMASCAGSLTFVKYLLSNYPEIDLQITDAKENNVFTLAKQKHHIEILHLLVKYGSSKGNSSAAAVPTALIPSLMNEEFFCIICDETFKQTTRSKHETSTLHKFNDSNTYKFQRRYFLPDSNKGFQMMLRSGWDREYGLGPKQNGPLYPVKTTLRKARSGLGVVQENPPRVTHFSAFDRDAVKWRRPAPKAKTKHELAKDLSREKRRERRFRRDLS